MGRVIREGGLKLSWFDLDTSESEGEAADGSDVQEEENAQDDVVPMVT